MRRDPLASAVIAAACLVGAAFLLLAVAIQKATQYCA